MKMASPTVHHKYSIVMRQDYLSHINHPYTVTSGDKAQITVLACGNAAGSSIPPMIIFDRKSLKPEMTIGEVPSTFYGLSESGWIDTELFEEWFKNHFLLHAPPVRPILLHSMVTHHTFSQNCCKLLNLRACFCFVFHLTQPICYSLLTMVVLAH